MYYLSGILRLSSNMCETDKKGLTELSEIKVIMPFEYTDEKENSLYAWRAFSYGKKIEIFC